MQIPWLVAILGLMSRYKRIATSIGPKPRLVDRIIRCAGSNRKLCTKLGVHDGYGIRWKDEGFITERWAVPISQFGFSDEWGHITAVDILEAAVEGRRLRKAEKRQEKTERLAAMEAALAQLPEVPAESVDPAG